MTEFGRTASLRSKELIRCNPFHEPPKTRNTFGRRVIFPKITPAFAAQWMICSGTKATIIEIDDKTGETKSTPAGYCYGDWAVQLAFVQPTGLEPGRGSWTRDGYAGYAYSLLVNLPDRQLTWQKPAPEVLKIKDRAKRGVLTIPTNHLPPRVMKQLRLEPGRR